MIDWQTIYFIALTAVFVPMVITFVFVKIHEWRRERSERKTKPKGSK